MEYFPWEEVEESFGKEYARKDLFKEYVVGFERSNLKTMSEDGLFGSHIFGVDESEGDPCLVVLLKKELPEELELPSRYKTYRVFSKVVGDIVLEDAADLIGKLWDSKKKRERQDKIWELDE